MAERRVALVMGNSAYQHVAPLINPANDAAAMRETLTKANFEVDYFVDLKAVELRRALRDFADKARTADVAVIYFAGHGLEVDGNNYIVPIDAILERDADVYDEAFGLDRLLLAIEPARQLRLVILDACRDNPFIRTMKRTMVSRSIGRGLAKIEPASPNTLIAFAAKAGSVAAEGEGNHSPFTAALVKYLPTPGLDLRKVFGFVRDDVLKTTNNRQEPFVYGSLGGYDVALVPALPVAPPAVAAPAAVANSAAADIRRDYELAERLGTRDGWTSFLAQYPTGFYADLARAQLGKLAAGTGRVAATESLPVPAVPPVAAPQEAAPAPAVTPPVGLADATAPPASAGKDDAAAKITNRQTNTEPEKPSQQAALSGPVAEPKPAFDTIKSVQAELHRVGCSTGEATGEWTAASRRALGRFNRYAGTKLDVRLASIDAYDVIHSKTARVCPLTCEQGFRSNGDHCSRIVCRAGYELGDDDTCERRPPPRSVRSLEKPERPHPVRKPVRPAATAAAPRPAPAAAGQVFCNYAGCRPVSRNCRIERGPFNPSDGANGLRETCN